MSWASDVVDSLIDTFEGCLDHPLGLAVAAHRSDSSEARQHGLPSDVFDIGSVTKTMTATILATLALDGVVGLDDAIDRWVSVGGNNGITLEQLATHTSGLPPLGPSALSWDGFTPEDPYAGYSKALAEADLRAVERTAVGSVVYSNFGYQILGLALEQAANNDFATMLRRRLCEPLSMTTCSFGASLGRSAQGYGGGEPVASWTVVLPGPGGVWASASDLLAYVSGIICPPVGMAEAMRIATTPRAVDADGQVALGWHIDGDGLTWHNGGTAGFHTMVAIDQQSASGIAMAVNAGDLHEIDDAVRLVMRGEDPSHARPRTGPPECSQQALVFAQSFLAGDWDTLRTGMAATLNEGTPDDVVTAALDHVREVIGTSDHARVIRSRQTEESSTVDIEMGGAVTLHVTFDDENMVAALGLS